MISADSPPVYTLKSTIDKAPTQQTTERFYSVGYVPQGTKSNPKPKQQLTIKGRWLEQFGFYVGCPVFYVGCPVIIKIEQGKLVIEIDLKL